MITAREVQANFGTWAREALGRARPWLTGRRSWWIAAVLALAAGAMLSWSWLVAIGLAPLLVAALPCAAMCALGLCMNRMMGRSCSKDASPAEASPKSEAPMSLPSELANAGAAVIGMDPPAKREKKRELVSAENTERRA